MRLGGKPTGDSNAEADFFDAIANARRSGKRHVVDFRIAAPGGPAIYRHFEFAGQVVKVFVAAELPINRQSKSRGIDQFVAVDTRHRAAGYVAHDVAARTGRRQSNSLQSLNQVRNILDGDPMELNVLPNGDVRYAAAIIFRNCRQFARLRRRHQSIRNPKAHHELLRRALFSTYSANDAEAIALRVYSPCAEIGAEPLRRNRAMSLARKFANFVEVFPGELFTL